MKLTFRYFNNIKIPEYGNSDPLANSIGDPLKRQLLNLKTIRIHLL